MPISYKKVYDFFIIVETRGRIRLYRIFFRSLRPVGRSALALCL